MPKSIILDRQKLVYFLKMRYNLSHLFGNSKYKKLIVLQRNGGYYEENYY
ncbi:hypothetical protein HMPREF3229_01352 [Peptoniphilus harei]|uniref:Uncharacterized protein n=1 Tax=Peptoniphilus harei TaxID=54005 RepID=A0A133PMD5_9FIRM|nr:hypothetical protein HMPREF3229_01352 [Peptoniphilus harei]